MNEKQETKPLEALLEKLKTGDGEAAEQVFLAYEPYLRLVVRRMLPARLRPKFDSIDVVQSIWADLIQGFRTSGWRFADVAHLRAFLVKVTRNRFLDRVRKHDRAAAHERSLEVSGPEEVFAGDEPRPSEIARANELWERLLKLCAPAHRKMLLLKRQGCSLAEISCQTGFHPSSIRRILYDLAGKVAFQKEKNSAP